jgi:hypothetical protein
MKPLNIALTEFISQIYSQNNDMHSILVFAQIAIAH